MSRQAKADQLLVAGQLPAAYRRAGGEVLEGCLQAAQAMVDELDSRIAGPQSEDTRFREVLRAAQALLGRKGGFEANELGLVSRLSESMPSPRVWTGIGISRVSSRKVRVRGPGPRGGVVLAWSRSQLEEAPENLPLSADLLPPGVCIQAVILDEEIDTRLPVVGQVIRAEVIWEGSG